MTELKRTPLHEAHCRLGARMVDFAGFAMPVQYTSILEEHAAVRTRAGLFDVSHMGQIYLSGAGSTALAERLLSCPVASLPQGAVRYGLLCNEAGGVVDDITVYRLAPEALFLCVNAANIEKDYRWILAHAISAVEVEDRSPALGLLALQGPASPRVLAGAGVAVGSLKRFRFLEGVLAGAHVLISRTGYTGSDGFEIYVASESTLQVWDALREAGRPVGLKPCGLGARDTLRLEAALPLYGHELDDTTSPLEARLDRFVKLGQGGGFIGCEAVVRRKAQGHSRLLVGFTLEERGIARSGHALVHDGAAVGVVTSGGPSPSLGISIGLGYVPPSLASVGTPLFVAIRERHVAARVVETPFVKASGPRRS